MAGLRAAVFGAGVMAAVSTLGDFVWATRIPEHRAVYGLTHGVLLFVVAGALLGAPVGRPAAGAVAGAAVGALGAGSFYVLAPVLGYSAMFVSWVGLWVALAFVYARLGARRPPAREIATRGTVAALTSGAAFYAISGIWRPFDPAGWDYAVHFAAWTVAYLPGFAALMVDRRGPGVLSAPERTPGPITGSVRSRSGTGAYRS